jgi:hypothetical protein
MGNSTAQELASAIESIEIVDLGSFVEMTHGNQDIHSDDGSGANLSTPQVTSAFCNSCFVVS